MIRALSKSFALSRIVHFEAKDAAYFQAQQAPSMKTTSPFDRPLPIYSIGLLYDDNIEAMKRTAFKN